MLNVNSWISQTNALGPGVRAAVWLQGCKRNCKGCISPEIKQFIDKSLYEPVCFANMLINIKDIQGITISGGEPFEQCHDLLRFLIHIKKNSTLDTMVYSGFTLQEIEVDGEKAECLKYIDLLIDGMYIESLPSAMWRGSTNQRIISPTNHFDKKEIEIWTMSYENLLEFHVSGSNLVTVGIPGRGFNEAFMRKLDERGINLRVSGENE